MKVTTLYFSATYTTKRVVEAVAAGISDEVVTYDITNDTNTATVVVPHDEVLVVGVPVYAGRVPAMAVERLQRFKGNGTPAVVVAVYGNRHYDDAVLELHDIMTSCGFRTVAAGAFIASTPSSRRWARRVPTVTTWQKSRSLRLRQSVCWQTISATSTFRATVRIKCPAAYPSGLPHRAAAQPAEHVHDSVPQEPSTRHRLRVLTRRSA